MPTTVNIESQRMLVGSTPVRKLYQGTNLLGTRIAELFANGEQGVWYDPSDLSTLFQDAAGTIPVTGVEQPVGLMLDKSGRGNHASQVTTTARPILRARYNLLTQTENLGHADWPSTQQGTKCTVEQVQAPDGSMTAQKLTALVYPVVPSRSTTIQGSTFRYVVWLKPGIITVPLALVRNNTTAVNLIQASYSNSGIITNQYGSCVVTTGPDGWKKFSFTVTSGFSPGDVASLYYGRTGAVQIGDTWSVWRPDFRYLNDAFNSPEYQRVGTVTDYDTNGFRPYLAPDGTDDWMSTGNIDFSSTNKLSLIAGASKLNEATPFYQLVCEFGPGGGAGSFSLWHPYSDVQHSRVIFQGASTSQTVAATNQSGTRTDVLTATSDLSVNRIRYKVSDTQLPNYVGASDPGTYGNLPLYMFSRGGTSSRFRGGFYGLIVVGRLLSNGELASAHEFMRNKSRAY